MPSETAKASLGYVTSYGAAKRGGYQGTYEEWCALMAEVADHLEENIQLNEDSQAAKAAAQTAEQEAEAAALTAESWAKGTKGGSSVPSTDPAYHDNAKYYAGEAEDQKDLAEQAAGTAGGYAEQAGGYSTDAEAWAAGTRGGEDVESGDDAYQNNAKYYSEQSSGFADDAAGSASDAEAWAKGTKNGTDVPSTDPTYHNNAKYWSEQAEETAEDIEASSAQIAQNASDIGDLKTQIINIGIEDAFVPTIYVGNGLSISASTPGKSVQNSKNARTAILAGQGKRYALTFSDDTYEYRLFSYDEDGDMSTGNALEYTEYISGNSIIPDVAQKIALSFRRKDLEDMTEEDGENIQAALKFYKPTGSTLRSEINKSIGAEEITGWKTKTRIRTDGNTVDFDGESTTLQYACIVADCAEGEQFTLTGRAGSTNYRLVCWCQADGTVLSRVANNSDYQDRVITAPAGAEKLVVNSQYTLNPPTSYYVFRGVTSLAKENALQEEVDEANGNVEILFSKGDVEITGYTLTEGKYVYYKDGTLKSSSISSATSLIDVSRFGSVKFKRQGSTLAKPDSGAAFYDADGVFLPGSGIRSAGGRAQGGYLPDLYTAAVPENAKYARFTVYSDEETYGAFEVYGVTEIQSVVNDLKEIKAYPIGLHTAPENQGVINAILRARQMTDIKWTPAFDLARALIYTRDGYHWEYPVESGSMVYRGKYAEGKEYRGLPYNEPHGVYTILGICTPIEAFLTACESDRSVEALESSYSTYGASYYACTCTILTCYALGVPYTYADQYDYIPGVDPIGVTITNGMTHEFTERLKLCDILQIDGHCALITDIIRDNGGDVTLIEVSEQTRQGNPNPGETDGPFGALCRRITLPVDKFTQMFDGFTVMRYANLSKVDYFPCLYSPVGDEGNLYAPAFHPVLPYMGNKSTHAAGNVKLLIQTEGFSTLIVKKDGEAFGTLDVTGLDEVTVSCPDEGKYTAYLASFNGSDEITKGTISCEWYVRPGTAPTWSIENGVITFSYVTRGEYRPYMAMFDRTSTVNGRYKMIFPEDCTETENQDGTYTVTCSLPFDYARTVHCVFYARSPEYGVAAYSFDIEQ